MEFATLVVGLPVPILKRVQGLCPVRCFRFSSPFRFRFSREERVGPDSYPNGVKSKPAACYVLTRPNPDDRCLLVFYN